MSAEIWDPTLWLTDFKESGEGVGVSYLATGGLVRKEAVVAAVLEGGHRDDNGKEWADFSGPCERLDACW